MPITKEQNLWLAKFSGDKSWLDASLSSAEKKTVEADILDKQKIQALEKAKLEIIKRTRVEIDRISADVQAAYNEVLVLHEKKMIEGASVKQVSVQVSEDGGPQFDFFEDIKDVEISTQVKEAWSLAQAKCMIVEMGMMDARGPHGQKNIFTTKEIIQEVWTPLVQKKIVPDTFLDSKRSEIQQMINATNAQYIKELSVISEETLNKDKLGLVKDQVSALGDLAKGTVGVLYNVEVLEGADKGLGEAITDLAVAGVTSGIDACEQLHEGDVKLALQLVFRDMASAVGGIIKNGTGNEAAAKYVEICMKGAASVLDVDPNKPLSENIGVGLRNALMTGLDFAETATDQSSDENKALDYIIQGFQTSIGTGAALAKAIKYANSNPQPVNWKDVMACALDGLIAATDISLGIKKTQVMHQNEAEIEKNKKEAEERVETLTSELEGNVDDARKDQIKAEIADLKKYNVVDHNSRDENNRTNAQNLTDLGDDNDEIGAMEISISDEEMTAAFALMKKGDQKLAEEMVAKLDEQLEREEAAFLDRLDLLQNMEDLSGDEAEMKTIAKLIKDLEQDRALWAQVETLASKGTELAKLCLEALGPGPVLVQLSKAIVLAWKRATHLRDWEKSFDEATVIPNPYASSIENFLNNQKDLVTETRLEAGILLVKLIGEVMAVTPLVGAGKAVSAGADMAMAVKKSLYSVYKYNLLQEAWRETKIALENPHFRRQNLYVRKLNPTLAKYTIAFGAIEAKDPIARSAMNRIGLTDEMLEERDTKAGDVKKYLELRYQEHMEVKKRFVPEDDWLHKLPMISLDPKRWLYVVSQATKVKPTFVVNDGGIKAALATVSTDEGRFIKEASLENTKKYSDSLIALATQLAGYSVTLPNGEEYGQMEGAIEDYQGYVEAEQRNLKGVLGMLQEQLDNAD